MLPTLPSRGSRPNFARQRTRPAAARFGIMNLTLGGPGPLIFVVRLHLKREVTRMRLRYRPITLAIVLFGLSLTPSRTARADFYAFTGTITSVDDPFGAFSNLAAVGAPVSGTFRYSDSADYPDTFQPNPFVTNYEN